MKALLSIRTGGPDTLVLTELDDPRPGPGEVLISVRACGVNYPDLLIIEDRYQAHPERPFAPGSEIAGVVESVGERVVQFQPGDRVMAQLPWG
jgi:NADPH:quinone reductase